jgi:AsmA protein
LKIDRLLVSGLTLSKLAATAITGNDRIAIEPLTAQLNGGALQARLSTTAAGHRLAASLTGADAGALIRDAASRDVLDGQGTVRVDLAASGDTADALTRSLAGTASLALRDGAIKGIDLDRLMQQVRAALDGRAPVEERVKGAERTPFSSLAASFRIAAGVARSDDLDFRANWVRAAGGGQIDLGAQSLDWLVRATVTEPAGATQDGAARRDLFARLQGLPVPIRIFGRYDDLRYRVDVRELATEAAKRELTRRLEKSIGEKLGLPPSGTEGGAADPLERLKGLLRR